MKKITMYKAKQGLLFETEKEAKEYEESNDVRVFMEENPLCEDNEDQISHSTLEAWCRYNNVKMKFSFKEEMWP